MSEIHSSQKGHLVLCQVKKEQRKMFATPDWSQVITDIDFTRPKDSLFANKFLMTAFGMASLPFKTLKIHASVIEKDGRALVFLGESGTGKSTHSRLWLQHVEGCSLLNDDEPVVRIMNNGEVRVFGSPWSGKTPCFRNDSAKVSAFVHLFQGPENKLSALNGIASFSSLFTSAAVLRPQVKSREYAFETITDILQTVPVYRLDCLPDREAVEITRALL